MSLRMKLGLLSTCLLALTVLPLSKPRAWIYKAESFHSIQMSYPVLWLTPLSQADLNQDGTMECLHLEQGQVVLLPTPCQPSSPPLWHSPPEWQVHQAFFSDLNRDGRTELALLVWRPFQPWPIDRFLVHPGRINSFHNSLNQSCHVILIGWQKRRGYVELWAGSALAEPLNSFAAADLDGNGTAELIALESSYDDPPGKPARALSVWEWNGFGFTLLARQYGNYREMRLAQINEGLTEILTIE